MDLGTIDISSAANNGFAALVALLLLKFMFNDMKHLQSGIDSLVNAQKSANNLLRASLRIQARHVGDDPDVVVAEAESEE